MQTLQVNTTLDTRDINITPDYEAIVPQLTPEEYTRLKDSIGENGLYEPITINTENTILDGHHRFKACKETNVIPRYTVKKFPTQLEEEIYVIETNVIRRQLNQYQKTLMGLKLEPMYAEYAKQRMLSKLTNVGDKISLSSNELNEGQARDQAAKAVGLSPTTYQRAKYIIEKGTDKDITSFQKGKRVYSVFKNIQTKEKIEELKQEIDSLDPIEGEYHAIVIDPPWPYEKYDQSGFRGGCPYPIMAIDEIKKLELPAAENCVIWLWTTNRFLHDAYHILEEWGFTPKSILTWVKDKMGVGVWLRGQTEHCILATKGKPLWELKGQTTVIAAPSRGHSIKPDSFYDLVDSLCYGRKLDYFARTGRPGWETYGTMEHNGGF